MQKRKITTSKKIGEKIKNGEGNKASKILEERAPYTVPDEIRLLKYFRKIKDRGSRQTVIGVARLAAKSA